MVLFSSGIAVGCGCGDDLQIHLFDKTHVHRYDTDAIISFGVSVECDTYDWGDE